VHVERDLLAIRQRAGERRDGAGDIVEIAAIDGLAARVHFATKIVRTSQNGKGYTGAES
jgi:hypothetical protein